MLRDTLLKKERTQKIQTYKILGDPVSLCSYVGKTVSFFVPQRNPLKLHTMDNFLGIPTKIAEPSFPNAETKPLDQKK